MIRVRLAAPASAAADDVADVVALLHGVGAPLMRLADARTSGEEMVVVDFTTTWDDPDVARRRVVDQVRARTSMDAHFARWVVDATAELV